MRPVRFSFMAVTCVAVGCVIVAAPARAESICGHVIDSLTLLPVSRAGVFVRETDGGAFTGWVSASDQDGAYCIDDVEPGRYDLEIRHEDYALRYVRGVVVEESVTGVDVDLEFAGSALGPVHPNPARVGLAATFRATHSARLAVYDARGRFLHGWSAGASPSPRRFDWDLRDGSGVRLAPGIYWLRLETAASIATRRFVVLH